jgi:hypothetical protein
MSTWVIPRHHRSGRTRAHRLTAVVNDRTRTACGRVFTEDRIEEAADAAPRCEACLLVGDVSDPRREGLRCGQRMRERAA